MQNSWLLGIPYDLSSKPKKKNYSREFKCGSLNSKYADQTSSMLCLHGQPSSLTANRFFPHLLFFFSIFCFVSQVVRKRTITFNMLLSVVALTFENISRKMVAKSSRISPANGMFVCSNDIFAVRLLLVNSCSAIFVVARIYARTRLATVFFLVCSSLSLVVFFIFGIRCSQNVFYAHTFSDFTTQTNLRSIEINEFLMKHFLCIAQNGVILSCTRFTFEIHLFFFFYLFILSRLTSNSTTK